MNAREEARRMAEVMLAFADGAAVQCRQRATDTWGDVNDPVWNWPSYDYCVKPKPCEEWRVVNRHGGVWGVYASATDAQRVADRCARSDPFSAPFRIVHMREVTE